jgi:hypothetical protein
METKTPTIQEMINADLKLAMLQKNEAVKSLLRVVIGEFNRVDKIVSNDKATAILKKMVENAKLVGNMDEVFILEAYLPNQLSTQELELIIQSIIADNGFSSLKDMGKTMNILKEKYSGQYDGKVASDTIKKLLS